MRFKIIMTMTAMLLTAACATTAPAPPPPAAPEPIAEPEPMPTFSVPTALQQCQRRGAETGFSCVEVAYGTNRKPYDEEQIKRDSQGEVYGRVYGPQPDCTTDDDLQSGKTGIMDPLFRVCHVGVSVVTIPRDRGPEAAGSSLNAFRKTGKAPTDKDFKNRFTVWDVGIFDSDPQGEFEYYTRTLINRMGDTKKHAIVFVHGFNVPFEGALHRAAQIKHDLQFEGPVFTYSWPSDAKPRRYLADQDDADLSSDTLARYLRLIDKSVGPDVKVHLVVHSLGTRVVTRALVTLAETRTEYAVKPYANVVFAGGDLDRQIFANRMAMTEQIAPRVTIYTSDTDRALACSAMIRSLFDSKANEADPKARVGLNDKRLGRPVFTPNDRFTTIDLSRFGKGWFPPCNNRDHATYVEEHSAFRDLSCVLAGASPNDDARRAYLDKRNGYWELNRRKVEASDRCSF